jgi:hypothetical protein
MRIAAVDDGMGHGGRGSSVRTTLITVSPLKIRVKKGTTEAKDGRFPLAHCDGFWR